jgi:hypothetical protein
MARQMYAALFPASRVKNFFGLTQLELRSALSSKAVIESLHKAHEVEILPLLWIACIPMPRGFPDCDGVLADFDKATTAVLRQPRADGHWHSLVNP